MKYRVISFRRGKVPRIHPAMNQKQVRSFVSVLRRHNPSEVHEVVPEKEIVQYGASQSLVLDRLVQGARKAKKIKNGCLTGQIVLLVFLFFAFLAALSEYFS